MGRMHRPLVARQRERALKHALIHLSRRLVIGCSSCGHQHVCLLKLMVWLACSTSSMTSRLAYLLLLMTHIYYTVVRALGQPSRVNLLHALALKVVMAVAHTVNWQVPLYRSLCVSIRGQAVAHLPLLSVVIGIIRHCSRLVMVAGGAVVIELG